jgi:hypothetical protein
MMDGNTDKKATLNFVKEVARYFMDFLETDFRRRRSPRRSIKLHNKDNLLTGINLKKYPAFNKRIWKQINDSFAGEHLRIKRDVYKATIPN